MKSRCSEEIKFKLGTLRSSGWKMMENSHRFLSYDVASRAFVRQIKISWHTGLTRCEKIARHLRDYLSVACESTSDSDYRGIASGLCHEIDVSGLNANERFAYNEQALSTDGAAMLRLWPQHRNMPREFDTLAPCDSRWLLLVGFSRLACFNPSRPPPE